MADIAKERGDNLSPQPFLNYAWQYFNLGFSITPCDNKKAKPWKKYQSQQPSKATIYRWLEKYSNYNIGLITGKISNLCVVDCDDNSSIEDLQNEFGESPFIVKTPRGVHLYYAFNGEKTKRNYQDRKIDIKAEGGLIIAPFSFNYEKKEFYKIIKGNLEDLPKIQAKSNLANFDFSNNQDFTEETYLNNRCNADFIIKEGQRNNSLFYELKAVAKSKRSFEALLEYALAFNNNRFDKSLPENEVTSTAKSIWQYKEQNKLWQKSLNLTDKAFEVIENKNSFALFIYLARNHGNHRKKFYISQKEVSKTLKMSENTLRKAIEFIMQKGLLSREKITNEKISKAKQINAFSYIYHFC